MHFDGTITATTLITAAAALIGFFYAQWQIKNSQTIQREATAKTVLARYLDLAFQHPAFALPDLVHGKHSVDYDGQLFDSDRLKFEQYEWFVSMLLLACREIFENTTGNAENRKEWRSLMKRQIGYHQSYFRNSKEKPFWSEYGKHVKALIESLRGLKLVMVPNE